MLESGQTNPGEGTLIQMVNLPWPSSAVSNNTAVPVGCSSETAVRGLHMYRSSGGWFSPARITDGVNIAAAGPMEIAAGRYVLISQWSALTSQMRVGIYNPATDTLVWGAYAAYRGFFPITSTGDQRMRWLYGLSGFPVGIGDNYFFNSVITDNDINLVCRNMTTQYTF